MAAGDLDASREFKKRRTEGHSPAGQEGRRAQDARDDYKNRGKYSERRENRGPAGPRAPDSRRPNGPSDSRRARSRSRSPARGDEAGNSYRKRDRSSRGGHGHDRRRADNRAPAGAPSGPARGGQRSAPANAPASAPAPAVEAVDIDSLTPEESSEHILRVMGFREFNTTKNTKVPGNDKLYAVNKKKTSQYRQYMNRTGGFNRPLSPSYDSYPPRTRFFDADRPLVETELLHYED